MNVKSLKSIVFFISSIILLSTSFIIFSNPHQLVGDNIQDYISLVLYYLFRIRPFGTISLLLSLYFLYKAYKLQK